MTNLMMIAVLAAAPVATKDFKLACPAGTTQVRTDAVIACQESGREARSFHGPYVSLYASGAVEAVGQTDHGFRHGKWAFYDEKGALTGETEFRRGNFDGRRVFYLPDGRLRSVEIYAAGRLVPPARDGVQLAR